MQGPHSFNPEIIWCQVMMGELWPSLEWKVLHQVVNIFHLVGVLVLQKSWKILLCVSLEGEPDPAPRLRYCFLTAPPLSLHPLPSLISNCLNLPFGIQGRGHRKAFVSRSPTGSFSVSLSHTLCIHSHTFPWVFVCINQKTRVVLLECVVPPHGWHFVPDL